MLHFLVIFIRWVRHSSFSSLVLLAHMLTFSHFQKVQNVIHAQLALLVLLEPLRPLNKYAHLDITALWEQWTSDKLLSRMANTTQLA